MKLDLASTTNSLIKLLPPELLQIIFRFVYEDYKCTTELFEWGLSLPENDDGHDTEKEVAQFLGEQSDQITSSKSPLLFPYYLAAVCDTWKNVLSSSPAFWTHVVLFVDSPPTPIEDASKYLEWSRQLPIDVFLLRKSDDEAEDTTDSQLERQAADAFIALLQPQMHRCRSLHVVVNFDSSLPPLSEIVIFDAPLLRSLYLDCKIGHVSAEEEVNQLICSEWRAFPHLHMMNLDAHSFISASARSPGLFVYQSQLKHLGISGFNDPSSTLSLENTLRTIDILWNFNLSFLRFSNLNFNVDTQDLEISKYNFFRIQVLILEDIDSQAVSELFRVCSLPCLKVLHLQSCSSLDKGIFDNLGSVIRTIAFSNPMTTNFETTDFLSGWSGITLFLTASDLSYDYLVDALAAPLAMDIPALCPHLQFLAFLECPIPSFASIKKMIQRRNCDVDYDDLDWKTNTSFGPAIRMVEIQDCWPTVDFPLWTQAEKDWLNTKVVVFTYITNTI